MPCENKRKGENKPDCHAQKEIQKILEAFTVEVIFLDNELHQGEELFARIENEDQAGLVKPRVQVSRYDGTPVHVVARPMRLNPAMIGKRGFASYTESHIAEIPDVIPVTRKLGLNAWPGVDRDNVAI